MIQYSKFTSGGFCLHKVEVNGKLYSAWYDSDGKLTACERRVREGVTAEVAASSKRVREQLQQIGNRYHNRSN